MKKNVKKVLFNQLTRKFNFITSPIMKVMKSKYQKKVMKYAELYQTLSIKPNQIIYQVRDGKSITDSPYAIFLKLNNHKKFDKFKHIWVVNNAETHEFYKKKLKKYKNVSFVIKESDDYLKVLAESKYIINNATFPAYFTKKPEQVYINTWHGTPLKHMGLDVENNLRGSQNTIKNFLSSDYIISPNGHTTDIFQRAFSLNGVYNGQILEIGYPRIDLTLNTTNKAAKKILSKHLKLNRKPIILYCPTWRGEDVNNPNDSLLNIIEEVKLLERSLPYQVIVKVHPFIYSKAKMLPELKSYLVPDFIDTNEIMPSIDLMITDYSSIFFDFLVTDKPIVFFSPDFEEYKNNRGLYIETSDLPGPFAQNIEEVIEVISNEKFKEEKIQKNYLDFKEKFVNYEDGNVTDKLIEKVFLSVESSNVKAIKQTNKEKILIYPGGMKNNGITTSVINLLENIDYEKYDVTIFLDDTNNTDMLNNISMVNNNVRIILRKRPLLASLKEHYRVNYTRQRGIYNFIEQKLYPHKVYEREFRKIFGNTKFDYAIDYSGYAMFWSNLVLASGAKKKIILLHSDIKSDMERKINGKRPHHQNLKGVISLYPYFDKLVSVSEATKALNQSNFDNRKLANKHVASRNTINIDKINRLVSDDSDLFEKDGKSVLATLGDNGIDSVEFSKNDFKIVTVGRLSPEKGFDLLIKAVADLVPRYPRLKLYILGEGPLKGTLKTLVKQLNVEENVFFLGQRRNPFFIMKSSDLFALTSHYEGQSMVILEALTVGINVLASDIIANRYVLEDGKYGELVENNEIEIAKSIEHFIKGNGKQFANFDAVKYNEETIQEFYSLLNK